ncbi:MAG: ABC transporter permease [Candidatus Sumerlaeota bacterium]|nr:ABC transporter permease [Candidatus Sumerlaeota bacterium]
MPPFSSLSSRFLSDYGMLLVLLALCGFFSWATMDEQKPNGAAAGAHLAREILAAGGASAAIPQSAESQKPRVLIVAREGDEDAAFADALARDLKASGATVVAVVKGQPPDAGKALRALVAEGKTVDVIAGNAYSAGWSVFDNLGEKYPSLAKARIVAPKSYRWPNFLKTDNLINVANQIAVIALIAIGMTMVIITGGIDLSVGSLIALSAVVGARLIRDAGGAEHAGAFSMILCSLAGIAVCALMGLFSGAMVNWFAIPPFIVTLGMMMVANGAAYILAEGQSIYQVPESFVWLGRGAVGIGRGAGGFGIPNAVLLMIILYIVAHVLMSRMSLGRYIYAVGGNKEAARLSGVPISFVLLFVYAICGALAGLGGIVTASQLKSGSPTYGLMYELYVIAAVVVGGTSLSGGEGRIFGTLIGAFIIAVIQNGMNLTGLGSYTQKIVLGLVILIAVFLDTIKKSGFWKQLIRAMRRRQAE